MVNFFVYQSSYSKIQKYVDISMNNNPDTLLLARFPNLAELPNLFFNLHLVCANETIKFALQKCSINCRFYYSFRHLSVLAKKSRPAKICGGKSMDALVEK